MGLAFLDSSNNPVAPVALEVDGSVIWRDLVTGNEFTETLPPTADEATEITARMSYATDGKCHNAEPGTFNHECGKPAAFIGTFPSGSRSGFCASCKARGYEARTVTKWETV
jgi:hypothetical protein